MSIIYSTTWDDFDAIIKALSLKPDDRVLTVTSAGDSPLNLCLHDVYVASVDANPEQNYLLEFKLSAIRNLGYDQFLEILGIKASGRRHELYRMIRKDLPNKKYWDSHLPLISSGISYSGRLETAFRKLRVFLSLYFGNNTLHKVAKMETLKEQRDIYEQKVNKKISKFLFHVFLNNLSFRMLFNEEKFDYVNADVFPYLWESLRHQFYEVPMHDNHFMHHILFGRYLDAFPDYMKKENFPKLKKNIARIKIKSSNMLSYLKDCKDASFHSYNLSDIFEWSSLNKTEQIFAEIQRTAKNRARVFFMNFLVERNMPKLYEPHFSRKDEISSEIKDSYKIFFYKNFNVYEKKFN